LPEKYEFKLSTTHQVHSLLAYADMKRMHFKLVA